MKGKTITKRASLLPWQHSLIEKAPSSTGLYVLRDNLNSIIYVGSATGRQTLRGLLSAHYRKADIPKVRYFDWYLVNSKSYVDKLKKDWADLYIYQ